MTKLALPFSKHTDCISNSAMLSNDYTSLLGDCGMHKSEENGVTNEAIVGGFKHLARLRSCEKARGLYTAQHKMLLLRVKTTVRESCN